MKYISNITVKHNTCWVSYFKILS